MKNKNKHNGIVKKIGVPYEDIDKEMKTIQDEYDPREKKVKTDEDWQKPIPFQNVLPMVSSIEASMLPEAMRNWLTDIAFRMKCPLDFVSVTMMVMMSSLIGTRLAIKPKTRDDWTVVSNLWGCLIGGPSTMKSPAMSEVLRSMNKLTKSASEDYEKDKKVYEGNLIDYEAQKKVFAAQAQDRYKGKLIESPVVYPEEAPDKPKERRYMVNDTTVEKLADLLNDNPTGLLLFRDELPGLLATWDRSGHEQDRAFHLEAWNGNGSMTIDRMGRGTTHVKTICESLLGGIQPSKLLPYLIAASSFENNGFIQRLQLAVYPDPVAWEYGDDYPDTTARKKAFEIIQKVVDCQMVKFGYGADDYNKFSYTRFTPAGQQIFKDWLIDWETEVLPKETGLLQEHLTKYRSLMPSIALILHVINCVDVPAPVDPQQKLLVSEKAASMAVKWCMYLMSHARRIYALLDTQPVEGAKTLLQHLKSGDLKDGFKARDVYRKKWTNLTTSDLAESALDKLVAHNWLIEKEAIESAAGRPESSHYLINPIIIQKSQSEQ